MTGANTVSQNGMKSTALGANAMKVRLGLGGNEGD